MPWSLYPSDVRQFSGLVQAAAEARFGAAATSEIIAQAARDANIKLGFQSYTALARMYGEYVGVRTAGENLAAAAELATRTGLDQAVTASMIGRAPYSPDDRAWGLNPYVLVKAAYSLETPEGTVSSVFSHRYRLSDVQTLGPLAADMQAQLDIETAFGSLQGGTVSSIVSIERAQP